MMNTFPSTTSAGSLFGNQQPASTSLFGAPKPAGSLFGTNTTQQSGGLFGQQSTSSGFGTAGGGILGANKPATSAFGQVSQPNLFGQPQQQQGGGLFGSISTAAPTFGSTTTSTSMFGNNTVSSSFGGFGQQPQQPQTGGLFGQKPSSTFGSFSTGQQTQQPFGAPVSTGSSMFGSQPSTGGGLFGQANTGVQKPLTLFGSGSISQQTGSFTAATKFTPPTGSDTMQLKGQQTQVNTKQMCISAMKDYETRSLEEIRCIDYVGGKKVNTSTAPGSNMFGQAIQQPQSGLFSKPGGGLFTATTSAPTTATNSLFNQPASSNLFGAPKPTGLFGAPTTQQSGGLFGQPSTGFGVAGGGILGANKPASSAFGQVSQPNIFGQPPQQQGGGLFGYISTSAPTFGSVTNSTSMFGGSTISSFGGFNQQPQQPQTGGIFGPKPVQPSFGGFGNAQQPPPSFGSGVGTGGSIFGPQPTTGGLFGQANTGLQKPSSLFPGQQAQQSNLFQNTQQTLGSPNLLLGSNINTAAFQQAIIESQLSSLPYGDSPLLKISTSPRKSAQDISSLQRQITFGTKDGQKSTSPQNSFLADISVVSTISKSNQDLSKEYSNGETIFDGSLGYKPIIILPSVGFGAALGLRHEPKLTKSWTSEKSFISGKSSLHMSFAEDDKRIKSLDMSVVFEPSSNEDHSFIGEKPQINAVVVPLQLSPSNESERPTIEEIPAPNETPPSKVFIQQDKQQQSTNTQPVQQQQQQKKYKIKLTRPEYYSEPSIEDLECLFNSNGICIIEGGLTVGRLGYGSVFWRGPIELKEPIDLDEIVHFRNKEVIVYPDENKKPEIGYGLNKPAEVSLDNVWPIDPRTKMPIKDADELRKMNFKGKLERLCARMDASFCDYQPFSGTWQFQVQHFSKYGFHEEDDEDDNIDIQQQQQQMDVDKIQSAHLQNLIQKAKVPLREIQKTLDGRNNKREYIQQQEIDEILQIDEDNLKKGFDRRDIVGLDEDSKLFQEQIIRKKLRFDDTLFDSSKLLNIVTNKEQEQQQTLQQKPTLVERSPKNRYEGLSSQNLSKSFLKKCGINFQLPSCRIGFNQDLFFAAIPPSTHLNVVNIYQTRVIVPTVKNFFLQYIRQNNLNQQQSLQNLELSELVKFDPPSPILCYLDEFLTCSFESNKNIDKSFAGICKILLTSTKTIEDKISQRILMGDWLCEQLLNEDKSINKQRKPFLKIFKFLINGQVVKAAEYAKEANLFNLALILSLYQSPSVALVRNLVAKQLSIALKQQNVDKDYLKILQLLSGEFKTGNVGCLEGLNWLQILGILIWYHASPTTTMIECLDILQELI